MQKIFIIDLENVHSNGFSGSEKLSEEDQIIIFESEICKFFSDKMPETYAKIITEEAHNGYPNAMDIKIIGKVFSVYSPDIEIYIISKDKGYEGIIEAAKKLRINNVYVSKNIKQACYESELHILIKKREDIDKNIKRIRDLIAISDPLCPKSDISLSDTLKGLNVDLFCTKINNLKKKIYKSETENDLREYLWNVYTTATSKQIKKDYHILYDNADKLFNCKQEILKERIFK